MARRKAKKAILMGKCIYCGEPAGFLRNYHPECAAKMEEKRKAAELARRNELKKQEEIQDHYYKVDNEYRALMEKHYKLTEKIGQLYSVASNLFAVDGPEMQKVIDLCLEDIALLPKYREICKEQEKARKAYIALVYKNEQNSFEMPPIDYWESYKRLAIIYEKQKRWEDAIELCKEALSNGITKDGNSSGFIGRAARLMRKMGNETLDKLE